MRNVGRFFIDGVHYRNEQLMLAIQKDLAVLNVRMDMQCPDRYEFLAVGKMFTAVAEGQITPQYIALITYDKNLEPQVRFLSNE